MSSRREEERNEKIIRGLMKLPPNRRCINCNSLGPQYVCTNFWTFVCTTCSGIHREFTHRVKSVSMSKFTSQEVDSLQKGGNQRARELYLKTWDPQSHRLPDNSNPAKVREFIKNVYVNRIYALENSSDRPPTDPQGARNHEDDKRRASSYHSYSQSPPNDFEYEERRYGKHAPTLTRKPGSDRGLYERNLSSFLSPSRFSDHANYDTFGNEGSLPRASDFSVSSGGYPFKSDVLSPSSQRDTGSPFSCKSNGGKTLYPQRTVSSGSFESFDSNSMSFKSVTSTGFLVDASLEPEPPSEISHDKSSSFSSPAQPSVSGTFGGLDLFAAPFAPQNVTSTPPTAFTEQQPSQVQQPSLFDLFSLTQQLPSASSSEKISDGVMPNEGWATGINSHFPGSSLTQPIELFQEQPNHTSFLEQQPSQVQQPSLFDLFSPLTQKPGASSSVTISDGVMLNEGGWASFDMAQNSVPVDTGSSSPATVPVSRQYDSRNFNPFSFDQSSDSADHDSAAATSSSFWHEGLQNVETTRSSAPLWNAFEDSVQQHAIPNVLQNREQALSDSNVDRSFEFSVSEGLSSGGNVRSPFENGTLASNLTSHIDTASLQDFSMTGSRAFATDHNPGNPFDLPPYDSEMESGNMSQLWDMSSLQAALPSIQKPPSYAGDVNHSWFSQSTIQSFIPGGVALDHPSVNLVTIPAQGPVGGNPFA